MSKRPIYGLVCAGGGAHGAYQVGVLKYIHEKFSDDGASPFRVFVGSSCGALNTSFFAAQSHTAATSRLYLEELWRGFHIPAYHGSVTKNLIMSTFRAWNKKRRGEHASWALLDPTPMKDVIKKGFVREDLEIAFDKKTTLGVAISATELLSGRTCWFQEGDNSNQWNLFHSIGLQTKLAGHHIEASCSIPAFMPPVKIDDRYYLDGSVGVPRPLSAVINMGATKILSIAADKPVPKDLPQYHPNFKPRFSHVIRMLIDKLGKDRVVDEAAQIEKLNQFHQELGNHHKKHSSDAGGHTLPIYHEEHQPNDYRPIDLCLFFPSKRIRQSGVEKPKNSKGPDPMPQTRFMFHEKFIGELIEFGYEDAKSKHEELHAFFMPEESRNRRWFIFAK